METKKKILVISAPFGNGHIQVSETIKKEVVKDKEYEVEIFDVHSNHLKLITKIVNKFYLATYKNILLQQIYRFFYYKADKLCKLKPFGMIYYYGKKTLIKKINEYNPDIIVSTFPIKVVEDFQNLNIDIPVYVVTTDYYITLPWVNTNGKMHYVATPKVSEDLQDKYGINEDQIKVTGIPIRDFFYKEHDKDEVYKKYGIPSEKKTITILAGAHGVLPKIKEMCIEMLKNEDVQLIVICGSNQKLYNKLLSIYQSNLQSMKLYQYVEQIDEIMCISDLLITKPGGITLTEAAYMSLPVVLYKPSYGQELENAKYFHARDAAIVSKNKSELLEEVVSVIKDEKRLKNMKRNIKDIALDNSSGIIVDDFKSDLTNPTFKNLNSKSKRD